MNSKNFQKLQNENSFAKKFHPYYIDIITMNESSIFLTNYFEIMIVITYFFLL